MLTIYSDHIFLNNIFYKKIAPIKILKGLVLFFAEHFEEYLPGIFIILRVYLINFLNISKIRSKSEILLKLICNKTDIGTYFLPCT